MTDLKTALGQAVSTAFASHGLDASLGKVGVSDRPDLADFQCNGALAAAKLAKANPREIAAGVTAKLAGNPLLASVEVAGAGFINLRVSDQALTDRVRSLAVSDRLGAEQIGRAHV